MALHHSGVTWSCVENIYDMSHDLLCCPYGAGLCNMWGNTGAAPVLVYSKADFRLYMRIILFVAGHDWLVSVTSNIARKMDIFGVLSLTSYSKELDIVEN